MYSMSLDVVFKIIALFIIVAIITYIAVRKVKKNSSKFYLIFLNFSIYIYSGAGLFYGEIYFSHNYLIKYIVGIILGTIFFVIISRGVHKIRISSKDETKKENRNREFIKSKSEKYILMIFFSLYIVRLVYPDFNVFSVFNPILDITNIFERRDALRENSVWNLFRLINIIFFPFFMIVVNKIILRGNKKRGIFILLLWVYLEFVTLGYISRNEILTYGVLIVILITSYNGDIKINKKAIITSLVVAIIAMPSLLAFEYFRMGASFESHESVFIKAIRLFQKETDYTKYYDFSLSIHQTSNIGGFFKWLFTLPIPRGIAGVLKENQFEVNRVFTALYTGVNYGDSNYSVILPSFLGEAFIIYGNQLYWFHFIFSYAFLAFFDGLLSKNKTHSVLNYYFIVQVLTLGRGGVYGYIGFMVNSMLFYSIYKIFKLFLTANSYDGNLMEGEINENHNNLVT